MPGLQTDRLKAVGGVLETLYLSIRNLRISNQSSSIDGHNAQPTRIPSQVQALRLRSGASILLMTLPIGAVDVTWRVQGKSQT